MKPEPPTTVELEVVPDISGFMRAIGGFSRERLSPIQHGMAKVQEAFALSQESTDELGRLAQEAAATIGADLEEIKEILAQLATDSRPHYFNATAELRARLNAFQRGEPLGPPINWRGLSGR